jgi:hypothetical protein
MVHRKSRRSQNVPFTSIELGRLNADPATVRTSQILCIAVFLSGDEEQIELVKPVAESLGVPQPRPATVSSRATPLNTLLRRALGEYAHNPISDKNSDRDLLVKEVTDVSVVAESHSERLWRNIRAFGSSQSAFSYLYHSLDDPSESVRVAAACALENLHPKPNARVDQVLAEGLRSGNLLVREMAKVAHGATPDSSEDLFPDVNEEVVGLAKDNAEDRTHSLLVHGTWSRLSASEERWYVPGAELPLHILKEASPDLYLDRDYFRWSSGYSDGARTTGAAKLLRWCQKHAIETLDTVYAHSHGGNVVLEAMSMGLKVNLLVLLHVPILKRGANEWSAIQENVGWVLDLRTPLDWVVIVDGLRTGSTNAFRGELNCVDTPSLPINQKTMISHTRYTKHGVWKSLDLASDVREGRSLV